MYMYVHVYVLDHVGPEKARGSEVIDNMYIRHRLQLPFISCCLWPNPWPLVYFLRVDYGSGW